MHKRLVASGLISFFLFILITSAWDYCHPGSDTRLFKGFAVDQLHQIKKPHHPCASLKDAYDFLPSLRISQPSVGHGVDSPIFAPVYFTIAADSLKRNGLSPPPESPPQTLPLFQLTCNLRI